MLRFMRLQYQTKENIRIKTRHVELKKLVKFIKNSLSYLEPFFVLFALVAILILNFLNNEKFSIIKNQFWSKIIVSNLKLQGKWQIEK
ncbi:hypothetical protein BpHYR1_034164 [Brachionus plicatilis]|uniref:Uncharacterized protein n=1 Tax=Brachionus plicatilis TaxID=10195 RepID=A0A3M7QRR8_BRAPC|nr:hypothetical protein BpHYR1_034164 [Brachionus plicatilis]